MKRQKILMMMLVLSMTASGIPVSASEFALSATKLTVNVGDTYDLDVSGTEKTPKWASWNINRVHIDQDGVVTAVRPGKATVSARVGLTTKKCNVTIIDPNVKLNKTQGTLYVGGTDKVKTLKLKCTNKGASKDVEWVSENPSIATVENGIVTPVSAGTTNILLKANGQTASCAITVKENSIYLSDKSIVLSNRGVGKTVKLTPSIVGLSKKVKWSTSDKNIATVSGGTVTGKRSGTATITATANGVSTTCQVTVTEGLISIKDQEVLLYTNETKQLKTNALNTDVVEWYSSNPEIAEVTDGNVVTKSAGEVVITAKCNGTEDSCFITVKDSSINIGEDNIEIKERGIEKSYKLGCEVVGRSKKVKWETADSSIATVKNGKVTAKGVGTTTISATANGVTDTVVITVNEFEPTIKLNESNYTLFTRKGNVVKLKATVDGKSKKVTWGSSNTDVAVVNKGKVVGVKEGQAIITATANDVTTECLVTVLDSQVILGKDIIFMELGEEQEIPVDVIGNTQNIKYKSSDSKTVSVKNGVVTAKDYGEADITITANNSTAVCRISVNECVHEFDEGIITKEATCSEVGEKSYKCTKCEYSYTDNIISTEHVWKEVDRIAPSCGRRGVSMQTCDACGANSHTIIEALEHVYNDWTVVTKPTEFTAGLEKQTCNLCGLSNTRVIPMGTVVNEHTHEYVSTIMAPTCIAEGYTEHKCECGYVYTDSNVAALGHDWSDWNTTKEPTELEVGEQVRSCSRCSETNKQELPKLDHTHVYMDVVTNATCTEKGYTTHTCYCKYTYEDTYVDALGHDWSDWSIVKEATEEAEGEESRECSRCKEIEKQAIPKLDHKHVYSTEVTAPTCTEEGYTTYTCDKCGAVRKDDFVDMISHDYQCKLTNSTCVDKGYTTATCINCGDSFKDNYTEPLGHDWSEWNVDLEATCENEGSQSQRCIRDNCKVVPKVESIPATGHDYDTEFTVDMEPTCTTEGSESKHCKNAGCTSTVDVTVVPVLEHNANAGYCVDCEARVAGIYDSDGSLIVKWEDTDLDATAGGNANKLAEYPGAVIIVIPDDITSICDEAFKDCAEITTVDIPAGVTSIGKHAFAGCTSLKDINIPEGVTIIGEGAFKDCVGLTDIVIPDGVEIIGDQAFMGCTTLGKVEIPETVTSIGSQAFTDTQWLEDKKSEDPIVTVVDKFIDGSACIGEVTVPEGITVIGPSAFAGNTDITKVIVPEGVINLGPSAFAGCTSLQEVVLPEGITTIEKDTFKGCTSLETIVIPDSVTSIESGAFEDCTSLKEIVLPSGITVIEKDTFEGCTSLETIDITEGVTSVGDGAFKGCSSLDEVTLPESLTSIGEGSFEDCTVLEIIIIPDGVTDIGSSAFKGCSMLVSIVIPEGVTVIEEQTFMDCTALQEVTLPVSLTTILDSAFDGCAALSKVSYNGTREQWGDISISGGNAPLVEAPKKYTCVGEHNYGNFNITQEPTCTVDGVKERTCNDCWEVDTVKVDMLGHDYSEEYTIDNEATCTEEGSKSQHCSRCESKQNVTVIEPKGHDLTTVYNWEGYSECIAVDTCTRNCNYSNTLFATITSRVTKGATCIAKGEITYTADFGVGYESQTKVKYIDFTDHRYVGGLRVEATCTDDGYTEYTCSVCSNKKRDTIPATGHSYGNASYTWNGYASCKATRSCSVCNSKQIKDATITSSISKEPTCTEIGTRTYTAKFNDSVFTSQYKYEDVPAKGHTYTSDPIYGWSSDNSSCSAKWLCSVCRGGEGGGSTVTSSVIQEPTCVSTGIRRYTATFSNPVFTAQIKDVEIPITDHTPHDGYCTKCLTRISGVYDKYGTFIVSWEDSGLSCNDGSGNSNSNILNAYDGVKLYIPDGVEIIGDRAFYNCHKIVHVDIPDSVTTIVSSAFKDCIALLSVNMPNSVTTIGSYAFSYSGLLSVRIPDGVTIVDDYTFMGCKDLLDIYIPDTVTKIGGKAFSQCFNLKDVYIPDSVTKIDNLAFSTNTETIIYCGALSKPSTYSTRWDLRNTEDSVTRQKVYWGVTREQYESGDLPSELSHSYTNDGVFCDIVGCGTINPELLNNPGVYLIDDLDGGMPELVITWESLVSNGFNPTRSYGSKAVAQGSGNSFYYLTKNVVTVNNTIIIVVPGGVPQLGDYSLYCRATIEYLIIPKYISVANDVFTSSSVVTYSLDNE